MQKFIFMDRDGTINPDEYGYISTPDDFSLYPFAKPAVKIFRSLAYKTAVVTNQAGIAYGYYTLETMHAIHQKMLNLFGEEKIDLVLFSPYHKNGSVEPYNVEHEDRKPGLGMFKKALTYNAIDCKNSFMIGDRQSDMEFGANAGLKTILVLTGNGKKYFAERKSWKIAPAFIAEDLYAAALIVQKLTKNKP